MADPLQPAAVPLAMPAFVDVDLPCFFCGYNLRSLGLTAICPECGHPVQESIRHGWLGYADPAWLRKLRTGITIPLWMILAAVVLYGAFTAWVIYSVNPATSSTTPQPPEFGILLPLTSVLGLGFAVAWLVSAWLLVLPEPVPGEGLRRSALATWIRALTAVSLGVGAILTTGMLVVTSSGNPDFFFGGDPWNSAFGAFYFVGSMLNGLAYSASFLLLLIHLRRLARRHYRKGLRVLMTFLIWGSVALGGLWLVFVGGISLVAFSRATSFATTGTFVVGAGSAGWSPATTGPASTVWVAGSSPDSFLDETTPSSDAEEAPSPDTDPSEPGGPTTQPAATAFSPTSMPVGGPPPFPFGLGFAALMFGVCAINALGFAWFVSGIVALFWFRVVLARAIRDNIHGALPAA